MKINIDLFVQAYLHTASWVECESGENTNFTPEAINIARKDCEWFIGRVNQEFGSTDIISREGQDVHYVAAHDLYLTRNGHGAGFWDSPEDYGGQENADRLTKIAHDMGECQAYHVSGRKRNRLTF